MIKREGLLREGSRLRRVLHALYGDVPLEELPRIMWLSATLCWIIGAFWLLDSLKDTVLATTVGLEYQPKAKLISVVATLAVVAWYNSLIDRVDKPTLFYIVGSAYAVIFMVIGGFLAHKTIGMENTTPHPSRLIGWISYFAIESFGSLSVALFWAFTNASIELEDAKSAYGFIVAFAQLGAILGSTLATQAHVFHVSFLYCLGGALCLGICGMVRAYVHLFDYNEILPIFEDEEAEEDNTGNERRRRMKPKQTLTSRLFDGFSLVVRYRYVALLLAISTLYEVSLTVLDFEMKVIGRARYGKDKAGAEQFAHLMGNFGQTVNTISFFFSLLCFSYIVRKYGLSTTILIFPGLLIFATLVAYAYPSLWTLFITVAVLKALTYALNEPALEMLYMVTSTDIKYKAKAWIDVVGARSAKAFGSGINDWVQWNPSLRENLPQYGNVPAFVVSLFLFFVSFVVGGHFERLVASGEIVGDEDSDKGRFDKAGSYELLNTGQRDRRSSSFDSDDGKIRSAQIISDPDAL